MWRRRPRDDESPGWQRLCHDDQGPQNVCGIPVNGRTPGSVCRPLPSLAGGTPATGMLTTRVRPPAVTTRLVAGAGYPSESLNRVTDATRVPDSDAPETETLDHSPRLRGDGAACRGGAPVVRRRWRGPEVEGGRPPPGAEAEGPRGGPPPPWSSSHGGSPADSAVTSGTTDGQGTGIQKAGTGGSADRRPGGGAGGQ